MEDDWVDESSQICIIDGVSSTNGLKLNLDHKSPSMQTDEGSAKLVWDIGIGSDVILDQEGVILVQVDSLLATGGFSEVYLVKSESQTFILKRSSVPPDPSAYQNAVNEIDILDMSRGNPHIVQLYDHKITALPHGGYEILLLLEYCSQGSVVDLMNRKKSFNEPEIIRIFSGICQAVKWLHLNGIIHRDLKVENVLHNGTEFKLCDFGSATKQVIPKGVALSMEQIRLLSNDINKYTTYAYRAPEICDLYHTKGINSKIDIWALGIFLYKLCFFTTPFEESGKLAILNGKYTIPTTPVYSKNLLLLIQILLQNDADCRPDIDKVIGFINEIQNDIPISLLNNAFMSKSPKSLLKKTAIVINPVENTTTPMRRGRPNRSEEKPIPALDNSFWDSWNASEQPKSPVRNNVLRDDFAEFDPLYSRSSSTDKYSRSSSTDK